MSQTELRAFHGNGLKPAVLKRALVREMEKHGWHRLVPVFMRPIH